MSAQLYPLLFDQIRGIVEKFFDQQGQVRPVSFNTFFTNQILHDFFKKNIFVFSLIIRLFLPLIQAF